jgi:hypothetical protein
VLGSAVVAADEHDLMRLPERPAPDRSDETAFAAVPSAITLVGFMTERNLSLWKFPERFRARVRRAAEQLARCAIETIGKSPRLIGVRLSEYAGRVMVEVWDHGVLPPPSTLGTSLTQAYVEDWDYGFHESSLRVVWCVLSLKRPNRSPVRDPRVETAFLRRVLDGINKIGEK